jgi:hypothetical protein
VGEAAEYRGGSAVAAMRGFTSSLWGAVDCAGVCRQSLDMFYEKVNRIIYRFNQKQHGARN